jgi:hypothetical protein
MKGHLHPQIPLVCQIPEGLLGIYIMKAFEEFAYPCYCEKKFVAALTYA